MAKMQGKLASVNIGGKEIAGFSSWTLNTTADTADTTGFSNDGVKEFIAACTSWDGSFEGAADDAAANLFIGSGGLRPGATITVKLYINATKFYSGNAIITGISPTATVDDAVKWSVSFQGTGTLTYPV